MYREDIDRKYPPEIDYRELTYKHRKSWIKYIKNWPIDPSEIYRNTHKKPRHTHQILDNKHTHWNLINIGTYPLKTDQLMIYIRNSSEIDQKYTRKYPTYTKNYPTHTKIRPTLLGTYPCIENRPFHNVHRKLNDIFTEKYTNTNKFIENLPKYTQKLTEIHTEN